MRKEIAECQNARNGTTSALVPTCLIRDDLPKEIDNCQMLLSVVDSQFPCCATGGIQVCRAGGCALSVAPFRRCRRFSSLSASAITFKFISILALVDEMQCMGNSTLDNGQAFFLQCSQATSGAVVLLHHLCVP